MCVADFQMYLLYQALFWSYSLVAASRILLEVFQPTADLSNMICLPG